MTVRATDEELSALAVISPQVRFVEWKALYVRGDTWKPVAPDGERKELYGEINATIPRWIYVFRRQAGLGYGPAALVDELHLISGTLSATPMEKMNEIRESSANKDLWPERNVRPTPVPVGESICFVERFRGVQQRHYFFGSRIRLPSAAISELQMKVSRWIDPITFDVRDDIDSSGWTSRSNTFPSKHAGVLVPIFDPITIALHLQRYYAAASNDLIEYTQATEHMSRDAKEAVNKRIKKTMISDIVDKILDAEGTLRKEVDMEALANFRGEALWQFRVRRDVKHEWATSLCQWLKSEPIDLLRKAYELDTKDMPTYLKIMAMCHSRLNESDPGRDLLDEQLIAEKRWSWIHRFVFVRDEKDYTAIREGAEKAGGAVANWLMAYAPIAAWRNLSPEIFEEAFRKWLGITVRAERLVVVGGSKVVFEEFRGHTYYRYSLKPNWRDKTLKLDEKWEGMVTRVDLVINAINFAFKIGGAVAAFRDKKNRGWAIADLMGGAGGGALDVSKSALEAFSEREVIMGLSREAFVGLLGFASGVIGTFVAWHEFQEAKAVGDMGSAAGSAIVMAGNYAFSIGAFLSILEVTPIVGIVALAIIAIGSTIKLLFGRNNSEYARFLRHCPWGIFIDNPHEEGELQPNWSDTKLEAWKEDYDAMFRALARLLCTVHVERHDVSSKSDERRATLIFGWIPDGTRCHVSLYEEWAVHPGHWKMQIDDQVVFTGGLPSQSKWFDIVGKDRTFDVVVKPHLYRGKLEQNTDKFTLVHTSMLRVHLTMSLGGEALRVPLQGDFAGTLRGISTD